MAANEKDIQVVTFRCPKELLAKLDQKGKGDRAEKLRQLIIEAVKQPGEETTGEDADNAAYEDAKKELRNAYLTASKIMSTIGDRHLLDVMERKALVLCGLASNEKHGSGLISKIMADPKIMKKLWGFVPVWEYTHDSIDPDNWELFLQYIEERIKQMELHKKVTEIRLKKTNDG